MSNLKFKPLINTIFIHIPKTAGLALHESVLDLDYFFTNWLGLNYSEEDKIITDPTNLKAITIWHASYKSLIESNKMSLKYYKRAFKFCFVRNPFDRLVSLYKYHKIQKLLNLDFDKFVELLYNEFKLKRVPPVGLYNVKRFSSNSPLYHKWVFGNQYNEMIKWIPPDIGFIGRFENLESDTNKLLKILGYSGDPIKIPHVNVSKGNSDYKSYYKNEQTIKYVKAIYRHDISRFGYKL